MNEKINKINKKKGMHVQNKNFETVKVHLKMFLDDVFSIIVKKKNDYEIFFYG